MTLILAAKGHSAPISVGKLTVHALAFDYSHAVIPLLTPRRLPKRKLTVKEIVVGVVASLQAGFGVVALFNAVGVYV